MKVKVYDVEFKRDGTHHYFGSQAAIFEWFTRLDIGISLKSLRNTYDLSKAPYENKRVIIRLGELHRKATLRGGHRELDY